MNRYSFWEEDAFLPPVDVTIAGAGFAGLWTAWHLLRSKPGLRIRILEKSLIPSGASTRNAGFACFGSLTELIADAKLVGQRSMQELVSMRWEGLQMLTGLLSAAEIDYTCDGGYELIPAGKFGNAEALDKEIHQINALVREVTGRSAVFNSAPQKLQNFRFDQTQFLVENMLEGQLQPGKVVRALLTRLQTMGVDLKFGVEVTGYRTENKGIFIETNLGRLSCQQFVICTNAFASKLSVNLDVKPARGQLLLTSPLSRLAFKGCFHADEGFIYFRNLGDRVLLGGARNKAFEEEETLEPHVTQKVQDELERYLSKIILPGVEVSIERRWSGIMGMSASRMPIVKELEPGVFAAVAMGGIGVAAGPVVGRQAAALLLNFW
jgi:gamma-glutamylputrescine oxidase